MVLIEPDGGPTRVFRPSTPDPRKYRAAISTSYVGEFKLAVVKEESTVAEIEWPAAMPRTVFSAALRMIADLFDGNPIGQATEQKKESA